MRRSEAASAAMAALLLLAATAGPALAQKTQVQSTSAQPTQTSPGFQFGGDGPIEIESDKLEVRDHDNIAIFTGNVQLVQGKLLLKTVKMTVYYKSSGTNAGGGATDNTEVDHMEAEGKVYIKQGDQVATGDQGTYDMTTGIMVLTGKEVVLTQGDNVVVGCKLVSNSKSGLSRLDGCGKGADGGRIKMLLQPGTQSN